MANLDLHRRVTINLERARSITVDACVQRLDQSEAHWVHAQNRLTRHRPVRACALAVSHIGNGWAYPFVAVALLLVNGANAAKVILAAGISVLIAHTIYPLLKSFVARQRPFASHSALRALGHPLDVYSFPSGHCMTAAAISVAVGFAFPLSIPFAILCLGLLAWARLACAHHYPSDLLCGLAIGVVVAIPVSLLLL